MKKNTQLHRHAAFLYSSFAIASCAMALSLSACQDYEYGYTESEVHQVAIEREYVKEFHKAFPEVDPLHTWMCEPDTIVYTVSKSQTAKTRAASQPSVSNVDLTNTLNYTWQQAEDILKDYMTEEADNRGKCAQSFEYVAFEDQTYDIYPVFWGRKFCQNNEIGVYWVDEKGVKHDLAPFWSDTNNNIKVTFADGHTKTMPNSSNPITYDPNGAYNTTEHYKDEHNSIATNYAFPHYTITVTAGTKWGLYLRTNRTQDKTTYYTCDNCGKSTSSIKNWKKKDYYECKNCHGWYTFSQKTDIERITWYSNASYNPDNTKAGATFHYDGKTYCSFEDAPHECTNKNGTGTCTTCGYGHYDHDFNDIVLYISPRPYETTFQSIKYRVMCEDLGGSFDWDFNDVVYDVVYTEDQSLKTNAKVEIILQAVGGTLPIYMCYEGNVCQLENGGASELHEILNGQSPNEKGLYTPVNVGTNGHNLGNKVVKTIDLGQPRILNMDIRDYVQKITLRVNQNPKGDVLTTEVKFPKAPKDNKDVVPQCFMTSTQTDWADELQPITQKYSHFEGWVMQHNTNTDWWTEGLGGTEQNGTVVREVAP